MRCSVILLVFTCVCVQGWLFKKREVCYGNDYGCFEEYENTKKLPESPEKIGLRLVLNNRQKPDINNPDYLDPNDINIISNSAYNGAKKLVLIIHGFQGSSDDKWVRDMVKELLLVDDVNIVGVDWEHGAKRIDYHQAVANTRLVGKMVSNFLKVAHTAMGTSYSDMHIVGHSLGAHIAGYAGKDTPGLRRITGLDPAGPCFKNYGALIRLDPTDALFVDVIHTDDEELIRLGLGIGIPVGHADFYPNGGKDQPGCSYQETSWLKQLLLNGVGEITDLVACNHMRAVYLYTASMNKCSFVSSLCSSYSAYTNGECNMASATMGYWLNTINQEGKYYLITGSVEPYC
ncbi:hypothetical protein SNE40_012002 [Patella caerulea]|uniref:Lipase domain-containing protein n=1 Tax=Patella caerulea TaxID=87958 RepID=A0AAN8PKK6_PATCE